MRLKPKDGMLLDKSVQLEPGTYVLPSGIRIAKSGIEIGAEGVTLIGDSRKGVGVSLKDLEGVVLRGLSLREYYYGVSAESCHSLTIERCSITSTAELPPNTEFLDIWLPAERAYGGGIRLINCEDCEIRENDLQHQMCGLLTYYCKNLSVRRNQCNYNSGFGIHLYATCDSVFSENSCDYCCRFEPREGGLHYGHMGADSTGFLIVYNSCRNKFLRNTARMGGDGFFLAGLSPNFEPCGCDENLFEENDASLSPNIAFEGTFSKGNIYRKNYADRCNYGFWCGYSRDFVIEENRMLFNRQAGIAVENGVGFIVRGNTFQSNGHGILLWSRYHEEFLKSYPDRDTSRDWEIVKNKFYRNGIGIRIAANQDHGIRNLPEEASAPPHLYPHSHRIIENDIQDNGIGIELYRTSRNIIKGNILNKNVEANLRLDDAEDNEIVNNLGSRGAYL
ncbi:MAG TPA: right-handed parallel beta-helix repeat-containing protein [Fimbriimonadales bacterium]|nr:right-handed parallel beta-helix repeat-containing protein [Fimbriimonadales bacterium]